MWESVPSPITSFQAAHHEVKIRARNQEYEEQTTSQLQDTLMSKHLDNMQRTSSNRNIALQSTIPNPDTPRRDGGKVPACSQKSVRAGLAADEETNRQTRKFSTLGESQSTPRRRKISISGRFIPVDRSSPVTGTSVGWPDMQRTPHQSEQTEWSEEDFN